MTLTPEIAELFKKVRSRLGAPVLPVELTDEQMCDLLSISVGDYAEKVQNWVLEQQWLFMQGNNSLLSNPSDMAYALTVRTMDWSKDYSYWFSRDVGLQQRGPYEMKKDFFAIEKGKQVYVIPAGREINKVLYVTPSTTRAALYGNMGMLDGGFAGGFGQYGTSANGMGMQGFYVGSAYDASLLAADLKYKNSLFRGDLTYKVTAGPNGTHLVHLLSVPGGRNGMSGMAIDDSWGKFQNCYCWYTYYSTTGNEDEDTDCLIANRDDILITPDQIPLQEMKYELMNYPAQQTVRQLFMGECMISLSLMRGKFSGEIKIPDAELKLDYAQLMELGKSEKQAALDNLSKRLEDMLPWNLMAKQAEMVDSIGKVLSQKPLGFYVI